MIYIIIGPTASGKTKYAIDLAIQKNAIVINADSSQFYSDLEILTARPTTQEQKDVPHNLFGFLNLNQQYSVAQWLFDVKNIIEAHNKNDIIIVGGSMMYVYTLLNGLSYIPAISPDELKQAELLDINEIKNFVISTDKNAKLDRHRLIKNYCLIKKTNKPLSYWQEKKEDNFFIQYKYELIKINPERSMLYENCNKRFTNMIENGAILEVEKCLTKYGKNFIPSNVIGYLELRDFLIGNITLEECIAVASQKTRNYAKRQITWIRNKF